MKQLFQKSLIGLLIFTSFLSVTGSLVAVAGGTIAQADTTSEIRTGVNGSGGSTDKNKGTRVVDVIRIVINMLLFFVGAFAVIMIVIAGFRFVSASGDTNTVSQARNTIIYAVVGIVVAFLAYALVNFVIDRIGG